MEENIYSLIEEAYEIFDQNKEKALEYMISLRSKHSEHIIEINYNIAEMMFLCDEIELALQLLIDLYNDYKIEEVKDLIFERYREPNIELFEKNKLENLKKLDNFKFINFDFLKQSEEVIYFSDENTYIYSVQNDSFEIINRKANNLENYKVENLILLAEILNVGYIKDILNLNAAANTIGIRRDLVYSYFSLKYFNIFIQLEDMSEIISEYPIYQLVVGYENLLTFFNYDMRAIPTSVLFFDNIETNEFLKNNLRNDLTAIKERREKEAYSLIQELDDYYKNNREQIRENIKNKKPKIIFISSIRTTAVQYSTRDLYLACIKMGIEAKFCIENDLTEYMSVNYVFKQMLELKPDIILHINYNKKDTYGSYFENLFHVNYAQDPTDWLFSEQYKNSLEKNEYIATIYCDYYRFTEIDYPKDRLIDVTLCANDDVYKPYDLTEEEKEKYSTDICVLGHNHDLKKFLALNKAHELYNTIGEILYKHVYNTGKFVITNEDIEQLLKIYKLEDMKELFESPIVINFMPIIYKRVMVDWIIDAGYTNIKLWGNNWDSNEKYKPYAMGVAKNGDVLSKIYNCSKINMGNNTFLSAPFRAFETILSKGFYLTNIVDEKYDASSLGKILNFGEDVSVFRNKEEMLANIEFYLNNEDKRQELIEKSYEKVKKYGTSDYMIKKIIKELSESI